MSGRQVLNTAAWDIQDHQVRLGVPAGQGVVEGNDLPYRPEALVKRRQNFDNRAAADPESKGYLPGVPCIMYMPFPFQIFQTSDHVAIAGWPRRSRLKEFPDPNRSCGTL